MSDGGHPGDRSAARVAPRLPRVVVLLSQQLASVGQGLDLPALRDWLATTLPAVQVHVVPSPARRPGEIARVAESSGAERLVLGLAPGERSEREIQAQARKAGVDPVGVVVLDLGPAALVGGREVGAGPCACPPEVATERAKLLLAAAVARARAFRGSRPEHLKAALSVTLHRRALFTLSAQEYRTIPAVLSERCAASRGCRRCLEVCPRDAIRPKDQQVEVNKARCEGCGLCLSACPREAIDYPGHSFGELDAQLVALLDPTLGSLAPRGILFVCQQNTSALPPTPSPVGWLSITVPCVAMLSPAVYLRCLALGAAAVGVIPCGEGCPFGQSSAVEECVAFSRELLGLIGHLPERVRLGPIDGCDQAFWALPDAIEPSGRELAGVGPRDPRAAVEALKHLARAGEAPADLAISHPRSPFGVVELDSRSCTGCEACAAACPSGALAVDRRDGGNAVGFDAALCNACGLCVQRCPEAGRGALRLRRVVDLRRLIAGRQIVYRDQRPRCAGCGGPLASPAMTARLARLLGPQHATVLALAARYCPSCRGAAAVRGDGATGSGTADR